MQDFGTKADNSPPPGGQLSAAEFNNLVTENENAVSRSGQALSGASDTQLAQSLFLHGVKSESFQDSGAANAYVATPVSGASGVLLPADYANLDGAIFVFKAANSNTGASTLNIGQTTGALLGTKPIRAAGDVALPSGTILSGRYVQVIYNSTLNSGGGAWELLPWSGGGGLIAIQVFTASGTFTPTPGATKFRVRCFGGGGGGGGTAVTAAGQAASGGGGAAGSYAEGIFSVSGAQPVTIGAAGSITTGGAGGAGGATSVGVLISSPGGGGGLLGPATATFPSFGSNGGPPGAAPTGGNIAASPGGEGGYGIIINATATTSGTGADSPLGGGGRHVSNAGGANATGRGAGGSGASANAGSPAAAGGTGGLGLVIIEEFA